MTGGYPDPKETNLISQNVRNGILCSHSSLDEDQMTHFELYFFIQFLNCINYYKAGLLKLVMCHLIFLITVEISSLDCVTTCFP
jgi:hypothetical protein